MGVITWVYIYTVRVTTPHLYFFSTPFLSSPHPFLKYFQISYERSNPPPSTAEELFEVAIEIWPAWDLNPQLLNSIQTL